MKKIISIFTIGSYVLSSAGAAEYKPSHDDYTWIQQLKERCQKSEAERQQLQQQSFAVMNRAILDRDNSINQQLSQNAKNIEQMRRNLSVQQEQMRQNNAAHQAQLLRENEARRAAQAMARQEEMRAREAKRIKQAADANARIEQIHKDYEARRAAQAKLYQGSKK